MKFINIDSLLLTGLAILVQISVVLTQFVMLPQITLDSAASEKFVSLLRVTLETLSQLLEVGTLQETGRVAEEILSYLRCTVTVEPTATVKCVQQVCHRP